MPVKMQRVTYYDRYTATTVALNQVNILPEVQGYITGIFFTEGTHVVKGQTLFEIDKRIYEDNYNTAAANLKVAEGNLKQAQQDADRYEYLNKNNAVAKQLYDHAMIALENAQHAYSSAEALLKTAETNLNYSTIKAPFAGTIGFSQVKLGDLVNAGQTVLITLSSDNPMGVDFFINEKQLSYFEKLQKEGRHSIDSLFTLILPDNTLYPIIGSISVIDRAVNPQTGSIRIRLVFSNPLLNLRAGMSCVVRVHNQEQTPQVVIPNKAVVEEMGEYFVYTVKDSAISTSDGSTVTNTFAFQKRVRLGETVGPNIIISSGIDEGDKIVVDGVQSLHNGSQVTAADRRSKGQTGKDSGSK
ncbi:MAG TPA: efflux RND transporter periplasmic adaptor subunit [Bacteroidota bacterium]|nr:efflux RND transporter periplasmic adaptor subunit [Bacteroidota bacterium]